MIMVVAAVFLFVVAILVLILGFTTSGRQAKIAERVEALQAQSTRPDVGQSAVSRQLQQSFYERAVKPILQLLNKRLMAVAPQGMMEGVRRKLNAAGNPPTLSEPLFLLLRGISMMGGAAMGLFLFFAVMVASDPMMRVLISIMSVVIIALIPDYLLQSRIKNRQYTIRKSLPDTLDLLVVSAEAGMGLDSALAEVIQRQSGPMAEEFERALIEIRLGKRRRIAWQDMAERVQVDELSALVAALYQAEELGVSVAKALRAHSDALRTQRSMKIRESAAILGTKMLFPLILFIFPALFVVILGPGILSIKEGPGLFGG